MIARLALPLCVCLVLAGCVAKPTAIVEPPQDAQATGEAVVLNYTVIAANDSETELPLRMVDYSMEIDGRRVFSGRRSAEATLSRKSEHSIELPVPVRWEDVPQGEGRVRLRGRLGYTLPGIFLEAMYDARLYRPTVEFEYEGVLDASALRGD